MFHPLLSVATQQSTNHFKNCQEGWNILFWNGATIPIVYPQCPFTPLPHTCKILINYITKRVPSTRRNHLNRVSNCENNIRNILIFLPCSSQFCSGDIPSETHPFTVYKRDCTWPSSWPFPQKVPGMVWIIDDYRTPYQSTIRRLIIRKVKTQSHLNDRYDHYYFQEASLQLNKKTTISSFPDTPVSCFKLFIRDPPGFLKNDILIFPQAYHDS